jgi:hypothetical protein
MALQKWYQDNSMQPKEKRNAGWDNNQRVVTFVLNYADDHKCPATNMKTFA